MKKSLIALAVAGALTVPAIASADATLYGHVLVSADSVKNQKLNIGNSGNSESRIGLRGTADTGIDGVTGIYQFEFGVNTTQTGYGAGSDNTLRTRLANVGLTGDFGTVLAGSQWTPHYLWATGRTDVFLSSAGASLRSTDTVYRVSNSAAYVSPNFSGFQAAAALVAEGTPGSKTVDVKHVAAKYDYDAFGVALSHVHIDSDTKMTALSASYDFGVAMVAAGYAHNKAAGGTNKPWDIAATYNVTDATALKIAHADFRNSERATGIEVQHDMSNMVNLFVGYTDENSARGNNDIFSTGIRVRF